MERKFEIIGESLNQLAKQDAALASRIPRIHEIIAFRNILIHGDTLLIERARVLRIAREALPTLRSVIAALIKELGQKE